ETDALSSASGLTAGERNVRQCHSDTQHLLAALRARRPPRRRDDARSEQQRPEKIAPAQHRRYDRQLRLCGLSATTISLTCRFIEAPGRLGYWHGILRITGRFTARAVSLIRFPSLGKG